MKRLPTLADLKGLNYTKGELAKDLYPDVTYDTALPQGIVDEVWDMLKEDIRGTVVMGYKDGRPFGVLLPLTQEVAGVLLQHMSDRQRLLEEWADFGLELGR